MPVYSRSTNLYPIFRQESSSRFWIAADCCEIVLGDIHWTCRGPCKLNDEAVLGDTDREVRIPQLGRWQLKSMSEQIVGTGFGCMRKLVSALIVASAVSY